ncbi:MAG: Rieske 2Fe-2S domain-containing protein [Sedimentisphaerales bacterium]|nr:Rieske 2Fe-2S domain-containing protein [Sedimentisphaerales bacterium]
MAKQSHTSRRNLLQAGIVGGVASILGGCKPAGSEKPVVATETGGGGLVLGKEESSKLLASEGSLLVERDTAGDKIMVVHGSDGNLHAVGAACTHAGCTVAYDKEMGDLHCPCHNSRFGLDGRVIKGPANKPLKTYGVRTEGGLVVISMPPA